MAKKEAKTNAMRILEQKKLPHRNLTYECDGFLDGITVAKKLGQPLNQTYKTLVTTGKSGQHYVFVIPVDRELDLKKAARAAGEKSVEMLPVKELTSVTGYVRGGCSPIGMKKAFPTFLEEEVRRQPVVMVSGGRLGAQIALAPEDLAQACQGTFADLLERMEEI